MSVEIREVKTKRQLRDFIQFPHYIYRGDPNYVPALYLSEKWILTHKNPFLNHSEIALFLAYKNTILVGRVASIYNKTHLSIYNDGTGFFGFFDAINDVEIAQALFNSSSHWLAKKGITRIMGPTNLTTNDSCGFLFEGFNKTPVVLMPYNFEYYNELCVQCGFVKEIDLFSYHIDGMAVSDKYARLLELSMENMASKGISIREVSSRDFDSDMARLRLVYNKCNENNWGFMPLDENEFRAMAKDLKMIAPLDLALLVEKEGEIIGFVIAVPDMNQALKHVKNGRLLPFGFIKVLWYKRKINNSRVLILGVLKQYSGRGIDLVMYQKIKEAVYKRQIFSAEACYVLESNKNMNTILQKIEGKLIKKYRIYSRDL